MVQVRKQKELSDRTFRAAPGVAFIVLWGMLLTACGRQQRPSAEQSAAASNGSAVAAEPRAQQESPHSHMQNMPETPAIETKPHQDHESKHGGTFFMALDEQHHLEGLLVSPGIFRVFIYDDRSHPLSKQEMAKADAKVTWGRQETAPVTAMKPSSDGLTLESAAPAKFTLPVELTLQIRFPGAAPDSRPELFTFPFAKFTSEHSHRKD